MSLLRPLYFILLLKTLLVPALLWAQPEGQRPRALILISSADRLTLSSPSGVDEIPVGFFLVELAELLRQLEDKYDFVFATPDGKPPTLDLNGLDLNFHVQGAKAPWLQSLSAIQNNRLFTERDIRSALGISSRPDSFRERRAVERQRREREFALGAYHLGRLPLTDPLPNTHPEVIDLLPVVEHYQGLLVEKNYPSFRELIIKDRDPNDEFDFAAFDFIFMPGGHAPMMDFKDNPELGEILNRFHEEGRLISAICHGPIALQSSQWRLDDDLEPLYMEDFPLQGTRVTTVSKFEEKLMLKFGYPRVPGIQATRLEYYVDEALIEAGFNVSFGSPMRWPGIQLSPGYPHIVFDQISFVLTGNGPQAMDQLVMALRNILNL